MRFIKPISLTSQSFILDIRTPEEYQCEVLGLPHVYKQLDELDPVSFMQENNLSHDRIINILCTSGNRASQAAEMFEKAGFDNVAVIIGGIIEAEYEGLRIIKH
ncbi:MAG: rhodanese-like domain-containing protein [Alphaproteobacteria bacterium]|nr:rhodanese-like domain-containing protein [Alphaproteobacteria bacterium]